VWIYISFLVARLIKRSGDHLAIYIIKRPLNAFHKFAEGVSV